MADLPHARGDRDPRPVPQPLRPAARARAVLAPGLPRPGGAGHVIGDAGRLRARRARARAATSATAWTTTRSTSSAGTATSIRTRSTSTTSSRSPGRVHMPPPCTRRSRARTSSSARSARGCSTGTSSAIPIPYNHSNLQSEEMIYYVERRLRLAPGDRRRRRSRCTHRACPTGRSRGWPSTRSAARRPTSWP